MLATGKVSKNLKLEDKIMGLQMLCLFTEPSLKRGRLQVQKAKMQITKKQKKFQ